MTYFTPNAFSYGYQRIYSILLSSKCVNCSHLKVGTVAIKPRVVGKFTSYFGRCSGHCFGKSTHRKVIHFCTIMPLCLI